MYLQSAPTDSFMFMAPQVLGLAKAALRTLNALVSLGGASGNVIAKPPPLNLIGLRRT